MDKVTLTIKFSGICSHFRNVVPGIPHRVVLPKTTNVQFGVVNLEWSGQRAAYYLIPHFPFLRMEGVDLTVPDIMTDGYVYSGARFQISNAIDHEMKYLDTYAQTPSMRRFRPDVEISQEVVSGGRAACYLDVLGGTASAEPTLKGAIRVVIELETDGPPVLSVVPFSGAKPTSLVLDDGTTTPTLVVANLEYVPTERDDPPFDFLLHYLTARGGIPSILDHPTPGMSDAPRSQSPQQIAEALTSLAEIIGRGGLSSDELATIKPDDLTPACSDSRYP